jgi:hypothetical protein
MRLRWCLSGAWDGEEGQLSVGAGDGNRTHDIQLGKLSIILGTQEKGSPKRA